MIGLWQPAQSRCECPIGLGAAWTAEALTIEGVIAADVATSSNAAAVDDDAEELMLVLARPDNGGSPGAPPIMRRFTAAFMCSRTGSAIN